jgi:hypothetical protein
MVERNTTGESIGPVKASLKADAIAGFNEHFFRAYTRAVENPEKYGAYYRNLKAGVELASGREVRNPRHALLSRYTGDGSFEVAFTKRDGTQVTRREHIPVILDQEDFQVESGGFLFASTRSFYHAHREDFEDRVNYEAYLKSQDRQAAGLGNSPEDDKTNYIQAQNELLARREVVFTPGSPRVSSRRSRE